MSTDARHVLVVDDNKVNRMLPAKLLASVGWRVSEAESGEQAIAWLADNTVDAVLLDISMPGMSGEEVCRALRASPRFATLRVVAYTAHAMDGDREQFLKAGFDAVLTKPISRQTLVDTLSGAVDSAAA